MKKSAGFMSFIFGLLLWLALVIALLDKNPGWVSEGARFAFYAITTLGGFASFVCAACLLGSESNGGFIVAASVSLDHENDE